MMRGEEKGKRLGKYELGRTLGEGNFGKVKYAKNLSSGESFAVKILEKQRILELEISEQVKREIGTLKLLKHANVVRLHEVIASKTKIYMVLEYVTGGELFDKIACNGRVEEGEARKLFQQLIDAVSYCHDKGVFHRDLKPENVLLDSKGNIKISDFGLSALPQHFRRDGLLHTTCGSPNYVAPEVLANKGYDGAMADLWSCGAILYVILTGELMFDHRNLAVLYQKKPQNRYERRDATAELTDLASNKRIALGDFTEICWILWKGQSRGEPNSSHVQTSMSHPITRVDELYF